ncbi:Pre-mRNA-splicing factor cwf16 [Wickerhamiella sorbophila]|uniref:Pre-mRNA-splicing factor cwf16 n=1 Tax=Wickerhamiella sorbophila TaxID=45607 RepID=A0A2T0FNH8_9ASCO|nr:Pre-mRNA-splicing factor cwf16 [Wickerhamiella sorbophila]PRT56519.1 Pre-mRNA-splicing factor cwf16 [Wickerhamiella sorbophila]
MKNVRLMAPFAMHCSECQHFIYKGTKFNARKRITDESYLDIAVISFTIRCPRCANEIVFKTDPKTSDYIVVSGGARNLEPWRQKELEDETVEERLARLHEEAKSKPKDALEELEKSTNQSKLESQRDRELLVAKKKADMVQAAAARAALGPAQSDLKTVDLKRARPVPVLATTMKKKKKSLGIVKK